MFKKILRKLFIFLIYGFVWLFVFSIPVANGKSLYQIGYYYVVDTKPVHWILNKAYYGAKTTENTAKDTAHEVIDKVSSEVKK
ncbi:hypothetical protein [Silvanigrella sp.]|jgi:hypothetical protein|uniref:hypothetical protein n=1 Tax=Silvanigrella sp. TaxID=2024976 RepID=UPI0037CA61AF|nr:hypothetical protein [Silvanigrellaceae bacterium]